ncbi:type IV pilus assembly protein FimV [Trinickia acidisoli]|uniref:type IV pilus assembly protein FimV n=1 Tax=Trinickia acidisoli TaxID=2767482 RepID=UPI001A8F07C7|nr:hypothetical protein [Trinickia acidisoli]
MQRIELADGGFAPLQPVTSPQTPPPPAKPASAGTASDKTAPATSAASPPSPKAPAIAPLPSNDATSDNQVTVQPGDTIWSIYQQLGLFANATNPNTTVAKNLPATPWLDPSAFGNRPANPANAVNDIQPGSTVTVLDGKRLDFLSAERTALQNYDSIRGPLLKLYTPEDREAAFDAVVAPVQSEIEYATLGTPAPTQADLNRIAGIIEQRAPNDSQFASAVATAVDNVNAELTTWGRTPDQLGQIISDAKSGNVQQLTADMQKQLVGVGQATLSSTGGDAAQADTAIRGRVGVYVTYLGTQNASLVTKAMNAAEQQLLVSEPEQRIVSAYNNAYAKGGNNAAATAAAAAAHQLRVELDPSTKLPASVAQIAASPQVQDIMRKITSAIGDELHQYGKNTTSLGKTVIDFSFAMQSTFDSDNPSLGMSEGKNTVDKMAGYLIDAIDKGDSMPGDTMVEHGSLLVDWLVDGLGMDGSAALPAALAAQGNATGNVLFAKAGDAALAGGIDAYTGTNLQPLQTKAAKAFVPVVLGPTEWGGLQNANQKNTTVQALEKGPLAGDLTDIANSQAKALQYYAKFEGVLSRYGKALSGQGFDSPIGLNSWWTSNSNSVTSTVDSFAKAAGFDTAKTQASQVPITQFWWQSRVATGSVKFFSQQLAKSGLPSSATPNDPSAVLSEAESEASSSEASSSGSSLLNTLFGTAETGGAGLVPRAVSGFMAGLFYGNSLVAASAAQQSTGSKWAARLSTYDNDGFAALYSIFSVSQLMNFVAPSWKSSLFGLTATHAAATPQRRILEAALEKVMASSMSDAGKQMTSAALKTALSGTGDLAGAAVAWLGLIPQIMNDSTTNPAHDVAYGLAGTADLGTYFARSMIQGAGTTGLDDIAGATFANLTADGWTGAGFVINIGAASIQFLANQDDIVHQGDSVTKYLEVQGVPSNLAEPFARHMMNGTLGATSAGPAITAYFRAKGKTNADMIDWMKTVKNGSVADYIATYFKELDIYHHDKNGNAELTPDQIAGIDAFLDDDVGPSGFKAGAQVHP